MRTETYLVPEFYPRIAGNMVPEYFRRSETPKNKLPKRNTRVRRAPANGRASPPPRRGRQPLASAGENSLALIRGRGPRQRGRGPRPPARAAGPSQPRPQRARPSAAPARDPYAPPRAKPLAIAGAGLRPPATAPAGEDSRPRAGETFPAPPRLGEGPSSPDSGRTASPAAHRAVTRASPLAPARGEPSRPAAMRVA
ncbi:translation initiation factor IF-2-like [Jatropha curcas]|uniref:translation initiation factor IF-2-like n=1 Tax=Jatropha curcas TaxID=180498 RepID=UPI0018950642|nr:translation initiation factor IF-2-like [Jatropha curcas]